MSTLGIELSDVEFLSALHDGEETRLIDVPDKSGSTAWPGYAYVEGTNVVFGRGAEDMWFVHPRRVSHNFWARLAHEPASLALGGKVASYSELAFFFLREFVERLNSTYRASDRIVLALPGAFLKDTATEDEKVGLLLGMAGELKLPLAGLVDAACAALCDPRGPGFNPSLPVVVLDLTLEGADVTLFTTEERLVRRNFLHFAQWGYAQLLKQATATMGNRFLRHTAFDILEDGRIEQTFFRQTKDFLFSDAGEFRYHLNTATRSYEMLAKREQLAADSATLVTSLVQSVASFCQNSSPSADPCTLALTDRAAHLPGLESRLRSAGFTRIIRLPKGAGAVGAARLGAQRLAVPPDLADVPLETSVALSEAHRIVAVQWDAQLSRHRDAARKVVPTHAILDGIGHAIGRRPRFVIGLSERGADLPLPQAFSAADDCAVPLLQDGERLYLVDRTAGASEATSARLPINAGDRLTVRCGSASAEIIFAHCPGGHGSRMD